jgi:hypothetical protein
MAHEEEWDRQEADPVIQEIQKGPFGWVQWKGTRVCMDVHCPCGELGHVDAEFAYRIRCAACGRTFSVCVHVRLIEISTKEIEENTQSHCFRVEPLTVNVDSHLEYEVQKKALEKTKAARDAVLAKLTPEERLLLGFGRKP